MSGKIKKWLDAIGHAETIRALVVMALPTVTAMATGATGLLGHVPLMWIIMAVAVSFGGAAIGMLSASTFVERKNPEHKLQVLRVLFNFDLDRVQPPNRRHRRSASAQGGLPAVPAYRHILKGQLGLEIWNKASFPISVFLDSASTQIEGLQPPRSQYPKKKITIFPGTSIWLHDDAIDLNNIDCDDLDGMLDMVVKYGLKGKERFEIRQKGTVEIFMETYGQLKGVYFHPDPEESSSMVPRSHQG